MPMIHLSTSNTTAVAAELHLQQGSGDVQFWQHMNRAAVGPISKSMRFPPKDYIWSLYTQWIAASAGMKSFAVQ